MPDKVLICAAQMGPSSFGNGQVDKKGNVQRILATPSVGWSWPNRRPRAMSWSRRKLTWTISWSPKKFSPCFGTGGHPSILF